MSKTRDIEPNKPILTSNDRVRMAVQLVPFILEREKAQGASYNEYKRMVDDNVYLANAALDLVDAIEQEARSRQLGGNAMKVL